MAVTGKGKLESETQRELMVQAPRFDARLLRNNVGALQDACGRWVHYGVGGNGGSDLIGATSITITPEMVGRVVAVFTAVEVKARGGRVTPEQQSFLDMVRTRGGIACVARCVEDYQGAIDGWRADRGA